MAQANKVQLATTTARAKQHDQQSQTQGWQQTQGTTKTKQHREPSAAMQLQSIYVSLHQSIAMNNLLFSVVCGYEVPEHFMAVITGQKTQQTAAKYNSSILGCTAHYNKFTNNSKSKTA